jgi:hypothetical protein
MFATPAQSGWRGSSRSASRESLSFDFDRIAAVSHEGGPSFVVSSLTAMTSIREIADANSPLNGGPSVMTFSLFILGGNWRASSLQVEVALRRVNAQCFRNTRDVTCCDNRSRLESAPRVISRAPLRGHPACSTMRAR